MHLLIFWLHHNFIVALLFITCVTISMKVIAPVIILVSFLFQHCFRYQLKNSKQTKYGIPIVNHLFVCLIYLELCNTNGLIMENWKIAYVTMLRCELSSRMEILDAYCHSNAFRVLSFEVNLCQNQSEMNRDGVSTSSIIVWNHLV